jgi:hypothetical protein
MARSTKSLPGKSEGPNVTDKQAFTIWLEKQPHQWSTVIAARAALRVLPLLRDRKDLPVAILSAFRATAIARFAAKFPSQAVESAANAAADSTADVSAAASFAAGAAAAASAGNSASAASCGAAASTAAAAAAFTTDASSAVSTMFAAAKHDAEQLHNRAKTPEQLANAPLWPARSPPHIVSAWQGLVPQLLGRSDHWSIWIDWYQDVVAGVPYAASSEARDAAYTDVFDKLPW